MERATDEPWEGTSDAGDAGDGHGGDVGDAVRRLVLSMLDGSLDTAKTNAVRTILDDHFGADARTVPVLAEHIPAYLHINLQAALDAYLAEPGRTSRIVGVTLPSGGGHVAQLLAPPSLHWSPPLLGPVDYVNRPSGIDSFDQCISRALVLVSDDEGPAAIWLQIGPSGGLVEVVAPTQARTIEMQHRLKELSVEHSPYRGQVMTIEVNEFGMPEPRFVPRPPETTADDLILPPGLLERIERHAVGVARARDELMHLGRHLKRGLLLFGPPGTGKTHTLRYLIGRMPEASVLILPGSRMNLLPVVKDLIAIVNPGVVVIDDVDLVAEDRDLPGGRNRGLLFEMLDILDGLHDDADLLFVFTTNRAELLEPAIAARPGRIDQAVEIPRPDDECRRRLFELYAQGLDLVVDDLERFVGQTRGVTASFIKEMLRRAAVLAADDDDRDPIRVTDRQLQAALDQLLDPTNPLTPILLGAEI